MFHLAASLAAVTNNLRTLYRPLTISSNQLLLNIQRASSSNQGSTSSPTTFFNDDYHRFLNLSKEKLSIALASPTRFQSIEEREDRSDIPISFIYYEFLRKYVAKYRGAFMLKTFFDTAVYYQLFNHVKPKTVIEMGSFTGASAMWYADAAKSLGYDCHVQSIEIDHSLLSAEIRQQKTDNVNFIEGDANRIEEILPPSVLQPLPHPWLVIEDSHENITNVLVYLNQFMIAGDYAIIEDTNPHIPAVVDAHKVVNEQFRPWGTSKLDTLKTFLKGPVGRDFKIDSFFTDFYGYNCTWHWHGFLRKCTTN